MFLEGVEHDTPRSDPDIDSCDDYPESVDAGYDDLDHNDSVPYGTDDLVHDELEDEECDDDEDDDNDSDSDSDLNLFRLQMHEPFRLTNPLADLCDETESVRIDRFDRRMGNIVRWLVKKAREAGWGQIGSQEAWFHRGFLQPVGKSSPEKVLEIFQRVIPASNRAIFGHADLTPGHIMALPRVDASQRRPGVYLIMLTHPSAQQHSVLVGLYVGSSTRNIFGRCTHHDKELNRLESIELRDGRQLPDGKRLQYLYWFAKEHGLVPSYREIGLFLKQLEEIGVPHADAGWLVRLLEEAMILLLDVYAPSELIWARRQFGITEEMYLEAHSFL